MTASSERWICPRCQRPFGRPNRPHTCAPAMSADEYFAGRPPAFRRVYEAIAEHLRELDGVDVEAVSVGILVKRSRTFAMLSPKRDRFELSVALPRLVSHPRVRRSASWSASRVGHYIDLHDANDVDDDVRSWLTEAYVHA